jgi:hypothetical protein
MWAQERVLREPTGGRRRRRRRRVSSVGPEKPLFAEVQTWNR